ncbi:proline--tRNA ligase [Desmonostoc muscorum LEGE 12446]|uniref:Proline--tRNA ligase n=1 Tax=Desmonostoc muscorum LEGE 12446 TaxID=1828758 RepID=A0A8J7A276_DESMC|nr:proline--tRNA ligase [Desmonostoc muscorum]MCF2145422.1 proline--tRNA ligase [Desmonostoc muscorum LEGE 12446]
MRLSQMLFVTLRDDPADAEIPSHKLLLRAGYIRRIGSGVYAYLPLMWRVLQKVSQIVREEMNATGAQECLLPQLQPADLWKESGRWDTYTKAEGIMFSLIDRRDQQLGLGPTHEEVITAIARDMIRSYRQLPLHLYQIQTKFRDEIRPRFGLMRGREFIMKDGYSFHVDEASLKKTYDDMYQAYSNMLRRSGLAFRAVEADSGAIGGSGSTEFMVLAEAGEDEVLYTEDGKYAANVEKAVSLPIDAEPSRFTTYEKRDTPGTETIETVSKFLKCSPTQVVKNVLYQTVYNNGVTVLVLVSIRGDQEVNEVKLQNELTKLASDYGATTIISLSVPNSEAQQTWTAKSLPLGYISPDISDDYLLSCPRLSREKIQQLTGLESQLLDEVLNTDLVGVQRPDYDVLSVGLSIQTKLESFGNINPKSTSANAKILQANSLMKANQQLQTFQRQYPYPEFLRLVDETAVNLENFVTGANETGFHVVGANWGKQFQLPQEKNRVDVRKARPGDRAKDYPEQLLQSARGIEAGHIFQLGTKYSQAMGATYTNEQGEEKPLFMGCFGVGVSRLAQAAVEQSYDKDGIIWPVAIAPYHAIVTIPNINDAQQVEIAEKLYTQLNQAGIETLLDDRDERAGVKFKDADLIGIPYRIVTGRAIANGKVEVVERATRKSQEIAIDEVTTTLKQWVNEGIGNRE